jgi:hypothetical protein
MSDTTLTVSPTVHRFDIKRLLVFLFQPRQGIRRLATEEKPIWLMPMLAISLMFLIRIVVNGYFQAHAAATGQVTLPPDWQYWTPEMQSNYMQTQAAQQGPVWVYIMPATLGLAKIWLAWMIVGGLTHLTSTLFGGRGKMVSALNLVAWACLPFVLRDVLRVIFMLIAHHAIISPGLSGLVTGPFFINLLSSGDLFFFWFAVLLAFGIRKADNLPLGKAILSVAIVLAVTLTAQAGMSALLSKLGGLTVTRMF